MADRAFRSYIASCLARAAAVYGMTLALGGTSFAVTTAHAQSVAVGVATDNVVKSSMVTIQANAIPLRQVIDLIAQQAALAPVYGPSVKNSAVRVTLHLRNVPVTDALEKALNGTGLRATIVAGNMLIERSGTTAVVTQGGISGTVVDAKTKAPLRGAVVTLDGASRGVTTGIDGTFRFQAVTPGSHTVAIRLLGYVKVTKTATVSDGQTITLDVPLNANVTALDQMVVTGTIVATAQKAIPNAMTVITASDIERRGITHIDELFRGDVPGLFATNRGTNTALDEVVMFSRGTTALTSSSVGTQFGTNPIKTYVDGVELADPQYLSQIDPRSIERIEIVTGPQASTIYGSNAINGVMQIFTKRGTTSRPVVTLNLMSGLVQNNMSSATSPVHAEYGQISGVEGRWSYNAGVSWDYEGAWIPGRQMQRLSGFGGGRLDTGVLLADVSIRQGQTRNRQGGATTPGDILDYQSGRSTPHPDAFVSYPTTSTLNGQTMGMTVGYRPMAWWSHELVLGTDQSNTETLQTAPGYSSRADTSLSFGQTRELRTSTRYSTTLRLPVTSVGQATLTLGADHWRTSGSMVSAAPLSLTGTLASPTITRNPSEKNAGGFVQGQIGFLDALFVTYGLRAEWNPNYGAEAQPNLVPRYGIAYTHEIGAVTTKVRAAYGRSTRPPSNALKYAVRATAVNSVKYFDPFDVQLANPDLGPEFQRGGEGGLEMYFGNRGALTITRYNQTVEALIYGISWADSVRSILQFVGGCPLSTYDQDSDYYCWTGQLMNANVGSIRNQGWELQGNITTGRLTTRGTYSWTKSRVLGVTPKYRALLAGYTAFQVGRSFDLLPEHTWATQFTYSVAATTMSLSVNGTGQRFLVGNALSQASSSGLRLQNSRIRMSIPTGYRYPGAGYVMADLNGDHRFSAKLDGILQVQNVGNTYQNDINVGFGEIGRQTKIGLRMRL